ncbi:hypothetical protein FNU79_08485 [Deinococcus detaillensis]|uniref:SCP2 domain-containing protein n=1 Tax=Deinococcus detaillensis TaxID=2592048 RepID=A0A553V127_9DEIO|nr:hypothetical protein FNU79_08485 [Deinococcus detaillensis]
MGVPPVMWSCLHSRLQPSRWGCRTCYKAIVGTTTLCGYSVSPRAKGDANFEKIPNVPTSLRFSASQLQELLTAVYASADGSQANVLVTRQLIVAFEFRDPELSLSVDGRSGKAVVRSGSGPEAGDAPTPDLTFHLSGDAIDRFWRGELNPVVAMTSGQLRIDGSLLTALALAPALPGLQAHYRQLTADWATEQPQL